jgi:hypothetical protein
MGYLSAHERGATIIELAVGALLIGIVVTMTLKGSVMIETMKTQVVVSQLPRFQLNVLQYREDFRHLPGDDPAAERVWRRDPALTRIGGDTLALLNGNAKIEGKFYDFGNPSGEHFVAWQDMRFAGLVSGDPKLQGATALPENPFGGFYGFDQGNLGQKDGSLCATKIPGRAAQSIDKRLDDGKINAGRLVATSKFSIEDNNHFDAPDAEPYNVEKEYIICVPLLP